MSKKGGAKKGAADGEDDSTMQIMKFYKRKLEKIDPHGNLMPTPQFKKIVDDANTEGENVKNIHFSTSDGNSLHPLGPVGARAIFEALTELCYKHTKSIKLWGTKIEDEGVRSICNYMDKVKQVETLDLLNNQITPLGCEFLGRVLTPSCEIALQKLKLDHNLIGTKGLEMLTSGLCVNPNMRHLSLRYCGIDADGAQFLQQILAFVDTKLAKLYLKGNQLKNKGVYELFRALEYNESLENLEIADNQFGEPDDIDVIGQMCKVMIKNPNIQVYRLEFNGLYDDAAKMFLAAIIEGNEVQKTKHIIQIPLPDHISKEILEDIKNSIKKNKKRKKKKGKKSKMGKKKK